MPHVGVREEDPVQAEIAGASIEGDGVEAVEEVQLARKVRRGIQQPASLAHGIDQTQAGHEMSAGRVLPRRGAAGLGAAGLGMPSVLGHAQDDEEGRRTPCLRSRGSVGEDESASARDEDEKC